jgi:hypothetical protein
MKTAAIVTVLALAAPALAQPAPPIQALYGVTVSGAGVTVRAPAGGCMKKSDFTAAVLKQQPQSMVLFAQKRPAACGPIQPGHADLVYSFDELGLKPGESFILANPLVAEP